MTQIGQRWTLGHRTSNSCTAMQVLRRGGAWLGEAEAPSQLASAMRLDFNRYLLRDGTGRGLWPVLRGRMAEPPGCCFTRATPARASNTRCCR